VDQRSNRLDVIFSAPDRMARSARSNAPSYRASVPNDGIVRLNNSQSARRSGRDSAGPLPPGSPGGPEATRQRVVTERLRDLQPSRNSSRQTSASQDARRRATSVSPSADRTAKSRSEVSTRSGNSETLSNSRRSETSSGQSAAVPSSSPVYKYEPTPGATPSSTTSYPAVATSTPVPSRASQTGLTSPSPNGTLNWRNRSDQALQWIKANRQASIIGGLALAALLVVLAILLLRRRGTTAKKAKRPTDTLAKPKPSADIVTNESSAGVSAAPRSPLRPDAVNKAVLHTPAVEPRSSNASAAVGMQDRTGREKFTPEPLVTRVAPVSTPSKHSWVPASPSGRASAEEDQEREVFEL
jgi:hypothetical protein